MMSELEYAGSECVPVDIYWNDSVDIYWNDSVDIYWNEPTGKTSGLKWRHLMNFWDGDNSSYLKIISL